MNTIKNFLLVLTLTASMAFADGHTGGGNRCDTCPPCTENCGGLQAEDEEGGMPVAPEENEGDSLIEYWQEIFFDLFG